MDFERFRPILETTAARHRDADGGRPALDAVLKFKMPVLQSLRRLLPEATEVTVRARPTKLHFCGLEPNETVQDANTLWDFREALTEAGTLKDLFGELKRIIAEAGSSGLMLIGMAFFKHSLFSARLHPASAQRGPTASICFSAGNGDICFMACLGIIQHATSWHPLQVRPNRERHPKPKASSH